MSVPSPCVRNCCLDDDEVCLGCSRTLDEILRWGAASEKEKAQILLDADIRKDGRRICTL